MRSDETAKLVADTVSGAVSGGMISGAGAVLSGAAMTTVTSTSWLIFTTTATVVAPWALAGYIAAGAVATGIYSAMKSKREIDVVNRHFK